MGRKKQNGNPGAVIGVLGCLVFVVGVIGTLVSFTSAAATGRGRYTVFYGAIVWGLLQIIYGFVVAIRSQNQPRVASREDDDEDDEDEDDRPRRRRNSRQQAPQVPKSVLIGCGVVGGVLLLFVVICVIASIVADSTSRPEGRNDPPPPENRPVPVAEDWGPKQALTPIAGATNDPTFREQAPDGGVLVGLDVGLGEAFGVELVRAIQPRFQTPSGEVMGRKFGSNFSKTISVKARPGYAIGAINVKSGLVVNGFSVTFMRIKGNVLDPSDSYPSEWIGDKTGGGGPRLFGGDGTPIIGIYGRHSANDCSALGLLKKL